MSNDPESPTFNRKQNVQQFNDALYWRVAPLKFEDLAEFQEDLDAQEEIHDSFTASIGVNGTKRRCKLNPFSTSSDQQDQDMYVSEKGSIEVQDDHAEQVLIEPVTPSFVLAYKPLPIAKEVEEIMEEKDVYYQRGLYAAKFIGSRPFTDGTKPLLDRFDVLKKATLVDVPKKATLVEVSKKAILVEVPKKSMPVELSKQPEVLSSDTLLEKESEKYLEPESKQQVTVTNDSRNFGSI